MESVAPTGTYYVELSMLIGFSDNQIDSSAGNVGRLPLSNRISADNSFCLGTGSPSHGPYNSVRELVEAHMNSFWKSAFEMDPESPECKKWISATRLGGDFYVESLISEKSPIRLLMGVSSHEQFFDYQPESKPKSKPEPERPSGNRTNRSKKRKNSRRKA